MRNLWRSVSWTGVKWTVFSVLTLIILLSWTFPCSNTDARYMMRRALRTDGDEEEASDTTVDVDFQRQRCSGRPEWRTDCHPDPDVSRKRCLMRHCCWLPAENGEISAENDAPPCFVPDGYAGYKVMSKAVTPSGTRVTLFTNLSRALRNASAWVVAEVSNFDVDTVRVRITDAAASRYEPPLPFIPKDPRRNFVGPLVSVTPHGTLTIDAEGSGSFEFHLNSLIFSEWLNQLKVLLPATILYGLKSQASSFITTFQQSGSAPHSERSSHVFFAERHERGTLLPQTPTSKLYGGHPFVALLNASANSATGLFLLNGNEVEVVTADDGSLTVRTTGGILDFFLFLGPTLSSVATQYQKLVGLPSMPPYHLLGSRKANAEDSIDIAGDTTASLKGALDALKQQLPSVTSLDSLLVHSGSGHPLACSGTNATSERFIDFTHPAAHALWLQLLSGARGYENRVAYTHQLNALRPPCCDATALHVPPAESPVVWTDDSACSANLLHLSTFGNLRRVYPQIQAKLTAEAIAQITRKRAATVSNKTFPGQGKWSGYWDPRPEPTWKGLNHSLADLLRYSMYGIPLFGTSICDFNVVVVDEGLCLAWLTVATFFPIYRYDPGLEKSTLSKPLRDAIAQRYLYIPYMYTLLHESSRYGKMVVRPMAFEFQEDPGARELEHQFMWGPSLLVAPRVLPGYSTEHYEAARRVYFPKGVWYDWQTRKRISSGGQHVYVPVGDGKPGVYARGGAVVPVGYSNVIGIVIALDSNGFASGSLYSDDGISLYPVEREMFSVFNLVYTNGTLEGLCSPCQHRGNVSLTAVTVLGAKRRPKQALLNGRKISVRRLRTTLYFRNFTHPLLEPFVLASV